MGRNQWRRLTACRSSRKRKLAGEGCVILEASAESGMKLKEDNKENNCVPGSVAGEGCVMLEASEQSGMKLTEDKTENNVVPGRNDDVLESSEDIAGRENGDDRIINQSSKIDHASWPNASFNAIVSLPNLNLPGIPLPASSDEPRPGVIFVFENASLVLAKINKVHQIINPDNHAGFMQKHNLNRRDYRPDIIHEVLKRLLGSRLNMSGRIEAVYVKTIQGLLIKIEPTLRVPKTLKGFCAMMAQLFQKFSIKGSGQSKCQKLFQLIQNPVTAHLPVGSLKIGLSSTSPKAVKLWKYFGTIGNDRPLVFVVGAMAHGKIEGDYTDDFIAVSGVPLNASLCVRRICNALERQRRIL